MNGARWGAAQSAIRYPLHDAQLTSTKRQIGVAVRGLCERRELLMPPAKLDRIHELSGSSRMLPPHSGLTSHTSSADDGLFLRDGRTLHVINSCLLSLLGEISHCYWVEKLPYRTPLSFFGRRFQQICGPKSLRNCAIE